MDKNKVIDLIGELIREFDVEEEFLARMSAKKKVSGKIEDQGYTKLQSFNEMVREIEQQKDADEKCKYPLKPDSPWTLKSNGIWRGMARN